MRAPALGSVLLSDRMYTSNIVPDLYCQTIAHPTFHCDDVGSFYVEQLGH